MKKTCLAILFILMSVFSVGCGKKNIDEKIMRVAYFPNITHGQALVMKEQGLLEEKLTDYAVSYTCFNAGPAEVEAMFAGEIDIGYIGPVPAISAYVKSGGDVQIIANASNAGAVLLKRIGTTIEAVSDLDGKVVAIPQLGNTQHLNLLYLLSENGLKPKSDGGTVEIVPVANADVATMMDQGNLDAALVPEPWGSILEKQGSAQVVLDYDEIMLDGDYPVAVVIVNKDFAEAHPDAVEKFLEAHSEAEKFINGQQAEAAVIMNRQIEDATGKALADDVISSALSKLSYTSHINSEAIEQFSNLGVQQGFLKTGADEGIVSGFYRE